MFFSRRATRRKKNEKKKKKRRETRMREENETFALVARVVYRRNSFAFSESVGALFYLYNFRFLSKSREKTQKFSSKKRATPKEKKSGGRGENTCPFPQPLLRSEEASSSSEVAAAAARAALLAVVVSLFVLLVLFLGFIREEKEEACLRGRRNARKRRSGSSFEIQIYLL